MNNQRLSIILYPLFLAFFAFNVCLYWMGDNDLWWHLKTGQFILSNFEIPRADPFSHTIVGHPWVTFEWLSQVLFYSLYSFVGAPGLIVFKALVVSMTFLLLFKSIQKKETHGAIGLLVLGLAVLAGRDYFTVRPQIFDYLFVSLILVWIRGPWSKINNWRIPVLFVIWVNLHGGAALMGMGFLGLRMLQAVILKEENKKDWVKVVGFGFLAMLVNPHLHHIFIIVYKNITFPGKEFIIEWAPPKEFLNIYGLFLVLATLSVVVSYKKEPWLAAGVLILGVLSLSSIRHGIFFILPATLLISSSLKEKLKIKFNWVHVGVVLVLLSTLAVRTLARVTTGQFYGIGVHEPLKGAADFLEKNKIDGKLFNEYSVGGYFIWRGFPVFVDGRNVEYGVKFIRKALNYYTPQAWTELENTYGLNMAVIKNGGAYRAKILDESSNWALVYWDDSALVYLKRNGAFGDVIQKNEYKFLKPNSPNDQYLNTLLQRPGSRALLLKELDRSVDEGQHTINAHITRSNVYSGFGLHDQALNDLRAAASQAPWRAQLHLMVGRKYAQLKRLDDAMLAYKTALNRLSKNESHLKPQIKMALDAIRNHYR